MKIAPPFVALGLLALSACASNPPPNNVTYNANPGAAQAQPPGPASNAQVVSGNTFYTAPVKTPVQ